MARTSKTKLNKRVCTLVLFLILEGMLSAFHHCMGEKYEYDVSCGLVMYDLSYVEVCSLYAHFLESFFLFSHKWTVEFYQKLFLYLLR